MPGVGKIQMPFKYPVALELAGRRCVVIGGGEIGEHKARGLLEADAEVTVIAPDFSEGLEQMASAGALDLVRREYRDGDLEGAFVAIAATDDRAINKEIFEDAQKAGVLLNAVDDNEHCHFAIPSIVRRGDFLVGISTGGKAPALAKRLRRRLSREFGPAYGTLVEILGRIREELLPHRPDFDRWAESWQRALDTDLAGLVANGNTKEVERIVREALIEERPGKTGKVWLVGAGPGDPDLISVKGRRAVDDADVVVHDRLVDSSLSEGKQSIFVGKTRGEHHLSQGEINELLVRLAREGKKVARLKGGDPFVFGRGAEEAEALAAVGVPYEIVSAPTSAVAVPAAAGIPVTDRRFASSVAFVTGTTEARQVNYTALAGAVDTIVILMGVGHLAEITAQLMNGGLEYSTPAAVIENGTRPSQRVIVSTVGEIAHDAKVAGIGSPSVVVIGEVVKVRELINQEPVRV
jgi:uroporphyrin-III C-methyltransferase/precorrin-2 dehydrogenase/sirohydrochlorin ferrochelatase